MSGLKPLLDYMRGLYMERRDALGTFDGYSIG